MKLVIAGVNLDRYEFTYSDDRLEYYFDSVGPKGVIRKCVKFQEIKGTTFVYNLAFGDVDATTGNVDDSIRSNNGDREMVVRTVAATVIEFCSFYPGKFILVTGRDPARKRLYQMTLSSHLAEVSLAFDIQGYINGEWERFRINIHYERLLGSKKTP